MVSGQWSVRQVGRIAIILGVAALTGIIGGCTTSGGGGNDPDSFEGGELAVNGAAANGAWGSNGGSVTYNFDCSEAADYTVVATPSSGNVTLSVYSDSNFSALIGEAGGTGGPETVVVNGPLSWCYVEVSGESPAAFSITVTSASNGPMVSNTSPADTETNVDRGRSIQINFNQSMDTSTLNGTNITISPAVAGTWSTANAQATFQPSNDLPESTMFTVTVSTAVTNATGIPLASPYVFTFTTRAAPPAQYTIGGTVTGLGGSEQIYVNVSDGTNQYQKLVIGAGGFVMDQTFLDGTNYTATVQESLFFKGCTVAGGTDTGTVAGANVTTIAVTCAAETFSAGGTVEGLVGSGLTLSDGTNTATISADGLFTFSTAYGWNESYTVTVTAQPTSPVQTCEVFDGTGTFSAEGDQLDVYVYCRVVQAAYPLAGPYWNDYVTNDGTAAYDGTDEACAAYYGGGYESCVHAGEVRKVVSGATSCGSYTAVDALGAFDWVCVVENGHAVFYSVGLKPDTYLSDLLDFSAGDWRLNNLIVTPSDPVLALGGFSPNTTPQEIWWDNPVAIWTSGTALDEPWGVYLVTADPMTRLTVAGTGVSLVSEPGVTITSGVAADQSVISSINQSQLWLEVDVDATGESYGINLRNAEHSVLRGVVVSGASGSIGRGIYCQNCTSSLLRDLAVYDSGAANVILSAGLGNSVDGALLEGAAGSGLTIDEPDAWVFGVTATANAANGIHVTTSGDNAWLEDVVVDNNATATTSTYGIRIEAAGVTLNGASVINNDNEGVRVTGDDIVVVDLVTSNNVKAGLVVRATRGVYRSILAVGNGRVAGIAHGIDCTSFAGTTYFSHVTATNNSADGLHLDCYGVVAENLVLANNSNGLWLGASATARIFDVVVSDNSVRGVSQNSTVARFGGIVELGTNGSTAADDCYNDGSTEGIAWDVGNGICVNQGTSDATFYYGATIVNSFTGKLLAAGDETTNASHTGAAVAHANINDWTNFDSVYRTWGFDGEVSQGALGGCEAGDDCIIWDWRVDSNDALLLEVFTEQLDGNAASTANEMVGRSGNQKFLLNAIEILDGIGDDDALCESNEVCLFTPNAGAYQGHGTVGTAGVFVDGTDANPLTGIVLQRYFFTSN